MRQRKLAACFFIGLVVALGSPLIGAQRDGTKRMPLTGGGGGRPFDVVVPPGAKIRSIHVKSASLVDAIKIVWEDTDGRIQRATHGGGGGGWHEVTISSRVALVGISGRSGKHLDSIRFHFSDGSESKLFGGSGGTPYKFMVPDYEGKYIYEVVGFHGRAAKYIDAIGIKYRER